MTNWEKFREVFGLPDDYEPAYSMCDTVDCPWGVSCANCLFNDKEWQDEYEEEVKNDN